MEIPYIILFCNTFENFHNKNVWIKNVCIYLERGKERSRDGWMDMDM